MIVLLRALLLSTLFMSILNVCSETHEQSNVFKTRTHNWWAKNKNSYSVKAYFITEYTNRRLDNNEEYVVIRTRRKRLKSEEAEWFFIGGSERVIGIKAKPENNKECINWKIDGDKIINSGLQETFVKNSIMFLIQSQNLSVVFYNQYLESCPDDKAQLVDIGKKVLPRKDLSCLDSEK